MDPEDQTYSDADFAEVARPPVDLMDLPSEADALLPAFEFTVSAAAHAELAALVGELQNALFALSETIGAVLTVLGGQAANALSQGQAEPGPEAEVSA